MMLTISGFVAMILSLLENPSFVIAEILSLLKSFKQAINIIEEAFKKI